jgi:hypothetical protein
MQTNGSLPEVSTRFPRALLSQVTLMGMELGQYGDTLRHTAHVATDFAFIV